MESCSSPGGGRTSQGIEMFVGRGTKQYNYRLVIVMLVIIALLTVILASNGGWTLFERLPISTIEDKALPEGAVNVTGYYTDQFGWMRGQWHLVSEMRRYYRETGVQPYVYIAGTIHGSDSPSASDFIAYTDKLYDELFTDEGHILLFYFQSGDRYMTRYVMGDQTKRVVSTTAANDLLYAVSRFILPDQK